MGWLNKILRGFSSSDKYSIKHPGRYQDEEIWERPPTAEDTLPDFDSEEIDRAIALSLLEEDAKTTASVVEDEEENADAENDYDDNANEEEDDHDDYDHDHSHEDKEHLLSSEEEGDDQTQAVSSLEEDETELNSPSEENDKGKKVIDDDDNIEEDEQLAKALQESLKVDSPPHNDQGNIFPPLPYIYAGEYRICVGFNA